MIPLPIVVATLGFAMLCVATDLHSRRIPNVLTGVGLLAGLALNALYFGGEGLAGSAAGLAVAFAVLLVPFALGGIGGGDVKMMAAVGALLGPRVTAGALVAGLILGGIVMTVHLVRLGRLRETVRTVGTMAAASAVGGTLEPLRVSDSTPGAVTLPYSVPLGLGTLLALLTSGAMGA
jgi:prepilin peptidase CpaA